ncbi:MAG: uroporphyrinogen-III C-methyltransferase [Thermanaerothrix sp.]|nr:uroporphyrinogen-III C-methyltransferase [Thermanaerothrix sp.]
MIWLVGAGCGSPRWLTLEALEVLSRAEAVVYDRLIHPDSLLLAPRSALFVEAGKRGGDHTMGQEEINRLLVDLGRRFDRVVRLKGGDPFVFGRGGEEAMALEAAGLPWQGVPGVTAALGGFLREGVPLTHRGASSGLCLATGQLGSSGHMAGYFEGVVGFRGSRVLYMSASNLAQNLRSMLSMGLNPETPCAVLCWGGWGRAKLERTSVRGAIEAATSNGIPSPSVILIGEAAALGLQPAEGPLKGLQVAVCRPMPEGYRTSRALEALGADAFTLPLLEERATAEKEQVAGELNKARWLVFTSPRGPRILKDLIKDLRLIRCSTAALGQGTAAAMEEAGIGVDAVPEFPSSDSLANLLRRVINPGDRVLFLRNRVGSDGPVKAVMEAGGVPSVLPLYEMTPREMPWMGLVEEHWKAHPPHGVVFGSAAMAEEWAQRFGGLPKGARAVAWGDQCGKACEGLFGSCVVMKTPDMEGLTEALKGLAAETSPR